MSHKSVIKNNIFGYRQIADIQHIFTVLINTTYSVLIYTVYVTQYMFIIFSYIS